MTFVLPQQARRYSILIMSVLLAISFIFTTWQVFAEEDAVTADFTNSTKTVDLTEALAGDTLHYTIVLSNTGPSGNVTVTDTLGANMAYVNGSFTQNPDFGIVPTITNGIIVWQGFVASTSIELSFEAILTDTLLPDAVVTNMVWIDDGTSVISKTAATTILSAPPADLSGSTKMVDRVETAVNSELTYSIILSNSGGITATNVLVTDTLPTGLSYVADSLFALPNIGTPQVVDGQIQWQGHVPPASTVTLQFQAQLADNVEAGTTVTNTAWIEYDGVVNGRSAATTIIDYQVYLPLLQKPLPNLNLVLTQRPNSDNQWTLSWAVNVNGLDFELQEAQNPNFSDATTIETAAFSRNIEKPLSFNNVYYYRIRAVSGDMVGSWSAPVQVIGGYRDDFNDPNSGWKMRRTTYLEETSAYYGSKPGEEGTYIIITGDRWDWILSSPLRPAPEPPYVIEYRSRVHDARNLISGGFVFGGDWAGEECPIFGDNMAARHTNCFNHFYFFNYIFYGPLKLQYERVDTLYWCPECQQSPLKRLGIEPIVLEGNAGEGIIPCASSWPADCPPTAANPAEQWHIYRMEVRNDGTRLYIDGNLKHHFTDTKYINEPYFGVLATTDEYKPSIWFFDYVEVKPLD